MFTYVHMGRGQRSSYHQASKWWLTLQEVQGVRSTKQGVCRHTGLPEHDAIYLVIGIEYGILNCVYY